MLIFFILFSWRICPVDPSKGEFCYHYDLNIFETCVTNFPISHSEYSDCRAVWVNRIQPREVKRVASSQEGSKITTWLTVSPAYKLY